MDVSERRESRSSGDGVDAVEVAVEDDDDDEEEGRRPESLSNRRAKALRSRSVIVVSRWRGLGFDGGEVKDISSLVSTRPSKGRSSSGVLYDLACGSCPSFFDIHIVSAPSSSSLRGLR